MALKRLSAQTMLEISGAWIDPDQERATMEGVPTAAVLLPKIEKVHYAVLKAHGSVGDGAREARIDEIQVEQLEVDALYDRKVRGVHLVLTGLSELADGEAQRAAFLDLRDRLFPEGLLAVNRSYLDEAGDARLLPGRLSAEARALLQSMALPTGKLSGEVKTWTAQAGRLGELEQEKMQLLSAAADETTPADQLAARNAWVRTVNLVVAVIEAEEDLDPNVVNALLATVRRKSAEASSRRGKKADAPPVEGLEDLEESQA